MNLNAPAPDFLLSDLNGQLHRLSAYRGRIVIISFWSAECGWSAESDSVLQGISEAWKGRVWVLRVASNACETDAMLWDAAHARGLDLILKDSAAQVADLYSAQTTPQLFVVDEAGILRYQGAFDNRRFGQRRATQFYLKDAVEALLAGRQPEMQDTPPYGCTILRAV